MMLAANACSARGLGSSFVCKSILRALSLLQDVDLRVVAMPDDWDPGEVFPDAVPEIMLVKRGVPRKLIAENLSLRQTMKRNGVRALISLADTSMLLTTRPHLLLIQQSHLAYPLSYLRPLIPPRHWTRFLAMNAYLRAGLRSVSTVTVQSNCMRDRLARRYGFPANRIFVTPSPVDVPESLLGSWKRDRVNRRYIFYPAHGDRYKNHGVLVDAMSVVKAHGMDLSCVLTVRQQEVPELVNRARQARILDSFEFIGRLNRRSMFNVTREASVVVVPSRLESFGLVFWEAMGIGCPVVASDLDFAREACGDAAAYCNPVSGTAFGEAIIDLLEDASHAERLSTAGRTRFGTKQRDWNAVAGDYAAAIGQL